MTKKTSNMLIGIFIGCAMLIIVGLIAWEIDYNSFDEEQVIAAYEKVENIDLADSNTLIDLEYANISTKDSLTYITVPHEDVSIVSAYDREGNLLYRNIEQDSVFDPEGILIIAAVNFVLSAALVFGLQILMSFVKKSYANYNNKKKTKQKAKQEKEVLVSENKPKSESVVYTGSDSDPFNVNDFKI